MKRAMSSSRKVYVSLSTVMLGSDQLETSAVAPMMPWIMKPSGASVSSSSRIPRWSTNAPMERKTSS